MTPSTRCPKCNFINPHHRPDCERLKQFVHGQRPRGNPRGNCPTSPLGMHVVEPVSGVCEYCEAQAAEPDPARVAAVARTVKVITASVGATDPVVIEGIDQDGNPVIEALAMPSPQCACCSDDIGGHLDYGLICRGCFGCVDRNHRKPEPPHVYPEFHIPKVPDEPLPIVEAVVSSTGRAEAPFPAKRCDKCIALQVGHKHPFAMCVECWRLSRPLGISRSGEIIFHDPVDEVGAVVSAPPPLHEQLTELTHQLARIADALEKS